jgi:tol-pal system protein YbgF
MKFFGRSLLLAALFVSMPAFAQQQQMGVAANFETRLSALEDEMRALNGQLEQLTFSIRRLDQNVQRMQGDYDNRLTKLEASVTNLNNDAAARAAAPQPTPGTVDGSLGALKTQGGKVTGAINNPQAPVLPDVPADTEIMTPQEQYDQAFNLLRQANYEDAEKAFEDFIANNPKDKMIDNAKYWHAETLYVRGRFPDAATGFADAYQQNTQGNKAPDSLLKLSMSLAAMNKTGDACTALAQLKVKYPNASPNVKSRAAEQRTKLKCS